MFEQVRSQQSCLFVGFCFKVVSLRQQQPINHHPASQTTRWYDTPFSSFFYRSVPLSLSLSALIYFFVVCCDVVCVAIARYVRRSNFHVECCSFIICTILIGSLKWVILLAIKQGEVRAKFTFSTRDLFASFWWWLIRCFEFMEDRRALLSVYCAPYIVLLGQKYLRHLRHTKRTIIRPLERVKIYITYRRERKVAIFQKKTTSY